MTGQWPKRRRYRGLMSQAGPYKTGEQFGAYILEEYLGAGTFKSVYRARNEGSSTGGTERPVVVALGFPHHQDDESLEEMRREFAVAERLTHPNILRVFDIEEDAGVFCLIMEYLDGVSLHAVLRENRFLPPPDAIQIAGLIAEALAYAHREGILHRDVKPENIFLTGAGIPKLLDFGVARLLDRTNQKASAGIGTAEYMSPEAVAGTFGVNSDLWALGITLYEMLAGTTPFRGEMAQVIQKILDNTPYDEAPLRARHVDDRIIRMLQKLLHRDPEQRYQSAAEVVDDLAHFPDGVPGSSTIKLAAQEKTQAIGKGILEYYHTSDSVENIGGLEILLEWFRSRTEGFSAGSRFARLPRPHGVMVVGVPGCGKSLSARVMAGTWGVPLLRLDAGRIFGSLDGESEANMKHALAAVEAASPCVLWIDDIEKGFAAGQRSKSGVTARIFEIFRTWLQESWAPVFVVTTANDLAGLPPQLLRSLDEIFFVGLPDCSQRETILRIHLKRHARNPDDVDIKRLAQASEGFSGAELEQTVVEGLSTAFSAGRPPNTEDLAAVQRSIFPLSRAKADEIEALTAWARRNARWASRTSEPALG